MAKKEMSFEEKIQRLSDIASAMDKGDLSLEAMLKLYEEGVLLYRECQVILEQTEAKIKTLNEGELS